MGGTGLAAVAPDGCGNCYVLTADGTVGSLDTTKNPGQIDRPLIGDLLLFMTGLLASDRDVGRAPTHDQRWIPPWQPLRGMRVRLGRGRVKTRAIA